MKTDYEVKVIIQNSKPKFVLVNNERRKIINQFGNEFQIELTGNYKIQCHLNINGFVKKHIISYYFPDTLFKHYQEYNYRRD